MITIICMTQLAITAEFAVTTTVIVTPTLRFRLKYSHIDVLADTRVGDHVLIDVYLRVVSQIHMHVIKDRASGALALALALALG
jgi:hypothetical protein